MKKEIIGTVRDYKGIWTFETKTHMYSTGIPSALDELLGKSTVDGETYKVTIEKV